MSSASVLSIRAAPSVSGLCPPPSRWSGLCQSRAPFYSSLSAYLTGTT